MTKSLCSLFEQIDDPRSDTTKLNKLNDILLIGVISVICGAETWNNMEDYARAKEGFLKTMLELPNGIPSYDTFNRVFSAIDNQKFESAFVEWVNSLVKLADGQVIAIDGKTIRGVKAHGKKSPIHLVSAWAAQNKLVSGQVKTDEKSNEITAIPKLLKLLMLENAIVTIDAMGCQEEIAENIIDKKADYILAVKRNQKQLFEDIEDEFKVAKNIAEDTSVYGDHGRIETRVCRTISDLGFVQNREKWANLKTIIKIDSTREFKNSDKPTEKATRYYISSLKVGPKAFQEYIRSHWSIENSLHWALDVAFGEDASRKRSGNSAQNFSTLCKIALNLLKNEKTLKSGVKGKRLKAGWDNDYLMKVLNL